MNLIFPRMRVCACVVRILIASVFIIIITGQLPTTRAAATFTVNSLLDTQDSTPGDGTCADANGVCTLRAAIQEANSFSGDDTINFSTIGTINLTGPLPVLSSNVTINGPGSSLVTVRRDTGGDYRILETSGNSSISGLTITNGRTPDGAPGGGIWQTGGELTMRDVVITGNATGNGGPTTVSNPTVGENGGDGGGIHATFVLTMTDCVISNNTTGNGGTGSEGAGSGGRGGGIYFAPGTLTLTNVVISGNRTGDNGGPNFGSSGSGGGILAGDPFLIHQTFVVMNKVTVTNNSTGNGGDGGDSGAGGGIHLNSATLSLTDSTVSNNHTGNANPAASHRTAGSGGGIFNHGVLIVTNSLISGNTTGSSGPGSFSSGGGIVDLSGAILVNTTVSGNSTGSGDSRGGGIYSVGLTKLVNCTITKNISPNNLGNGVTGNQGFYSVANTIIAGNGASGNGPDLDQGSFIPPTYFSRGHNLIGNAQGVADFDEPGDQTGSTATPLDPKLGPLANNGGPTLTHALLTNSPALDAGDNVFAADASGNFVLTTDQRGVRRFADSPDADSTATVDIGAFEFLQTLEDISDKTINEDTTLNVTFGLGDNGPGVTSATVTSNNQTLLPEANLVLSGAGAARSLQITPAANRSGVALITVTANLSGGGTLTDTFTLTVRSVNDRPSFSIPGAQTVLEDAGAQTVPNFAGNVSAGPLEDAQSLSFTVTITNPGLFSVAPSVSSAGTLTYTPAPNANGNANVTLILKDNGGTENGGEDTSSEQSFTISVTPVNDAPTFTKGANQTVNEDVGFQFVFDWATNISQGPNEFDSFEFQITNNTNPGLFALQPLVFSGILQYGTASNASGSADITIVLKDTGGTANGGMDTSAPQTFTITVNPVNDAPLINLQDFFVETNQHTPLVFSAANFNGITLSDVDAGADPVRVTLTAPQGGLTLPSIAGLAFVTGDGVDDETMTFTGGIGTINSRLNGLTFKPNNGFSGFTNLQIVVDDQGRNGAGGAKTATGNITISVNSGGRFSFNTATYGVNESGTTATITVLRGGFAGTASVNYATSNGTATAGANCTSGVDYLPASGTFTWNDGDGSVRQFVITICNDAANENDETINLTLSNASGTGSLGTQPTAILTIGNDDAPPVLLTEEFTEHAIALDLVSQTRDPFSLINPFNTGNDQRRRVSLFVWRLGLLPSDTVASVQVLARDDEGRTYNLPVEALNPMITLPDVTQVVVRLPDNVIGAPRDLWLKVTLRGQGSNEAFIKIA